MEQQRQSLRPLPEDHAFARAVVSALEESLVREALAALIEVLAVPCLVYAAEGRVLMSNAAARRLGFAGSDQQDSEPDEKADAIWGEISQEVSWGRIVPEFETQLLNENGEQRTIPVKAIPLRGPGGDVLGAVVVGAAAEGDGQAARTIDAIAVGVSSATGEAFFESLARYVAEALDADLVCVGELVEEGDRVRSIMFWKDGAPADQIEFEAAGTPCVDAITDGVVCVTSNVRDRFPGARLLKDNDVEAYAGAALTSSDGEPIGVISAMWRRALNEPDPETVQAVLRIFAARGGGEIQRRRTLEDLAESEERYGSLFEQNRMAILLIDPASSQIVDANDAACAYYGFSHEDVTSMSIFQIDTLDPEHSREELQRALDGSRSRFQFKHRLSDGTVRDVEVYMGPISVFGREILYAIVHDVTERRRAEYELEHYKERLEHTVEERTEELVRVNEQLRQANKVKDVFFAHTSHELRTPLNSITGFSDVLLKELPGELNEEQRKQVQMISDSGRHLTTLVDDLIDLVRVESGELVCEPEEFEFVSLAKGVFAGFRPVAVEKGLDLRFTSHTETFGMYNDRIKVQRCLLTLLGHALDMTESGSVRVSLGIEDARTVVVEIVDTGRGLTREETAALSGSSAAPVLPGGADTGGPGLALTLTGRLASLLGGRIDVSSAPAEGSRVVLIVPSARQGDAAGNEAGVAEE